MIDQYSAQRYTVFAAFVNLYITTSNPLFKACAEIFIYNGGHSPSPNAQPLRRSPAQYAALPISETHNGHLLNRFASARGNEKDETALHKRRNMPHKIEVFDRDNDPDCVPGQEFVAVVLSVTGGNWFNTGMVVRAASPDAAFREALSMAREAHLPF